MRVGDVYGLLVEWCYHQGNADQALQLIRQMEARGIAPVPYVEADMVAAIYKVCLKMLASVLFCTVAAPCGLHAHRHPAAFHCRDTLMDQTIH